MFEYKVLTERDTRLSEKFDLESLEITLNSQARQGWRLAEGFVAANLAKSAKAEIVLILERSTDRKVDPGRHHQRGLSSSPVGRAFPVASLDAEAGCAGRRTLRPCPLRRETQQARDGSSGTGQR